jgi:hypothetical protein
MTWGLIKHKVRFAFTVYLFKRIRFPYIVGWKDNVDDEIRRLQCEVVVAYLKVLSRHFMEGLKKIE